MQNAIPKMVTDFSFDFCAKEIFRENLHTNDCI